MSYQGGKVALMMAALLLVFAGPASADDGICNNGDVIACPKTDKSGAYVGLTREQVLNMPKFPEDAGKGVTPERPKDAPAYEYMSLNDCAEAQPGTITQDVSCAHALRDCPSDMVGPYLRIWRRTVVAGRETEPWTIHGTTCAADVAPGARPTLTMADLKAAFMRTPWSKPQISSQPKGNTTLVNLLTFYKVNWTAAGFEPGEVDHSVLRGIPVQIRPKLVGFTYVFGDGAQMGPTTSTGGEYPDGDVTHTYRIKGEYPVHVDTTFGADFSLDGTTWEEIPSTVTVPGPATTVTVREAKSVLVNH